MIVRIKIIQIIFFFFFLKLIKKIKKDEFRLYYFGDCKRCRKGNENKIVLDKDIDNNIVKFSDILERPYKSFFLLSFFNLI